MSGSAWASYRLSCGRSRHPGTAPIRSGCRLNNRTKGGRIQVDLAFERMDLMRMDFASKWNRMMSWVAVAVLIALTTGAVFLILGKLRDLQP